MNSPVTPICAPKPSAAEAQHRVFANAYSRRQGVFTLVRQLHQLSRAVQRHRGMSMALLAGSAGFVRDLALLQAQLDRRLEALGVFAEQTQLLDPREQVRLSTAWATIRADWQDDDVVDNFELHSHFIEQLQGLIMQLARQLEQPVTLEVAEQEGLELPPEPETAHPKLFKHIELIHFATRQAPEMIEQIARIRGLATYAAARGVCDDHLASKLRYAITCTRAGNEKVRHQAERLQGFLGGAMRSFTIVKTFELKLMFLLSTVEGDVLTPGPIVISGQQLFKLASEIIDVYLAVVDEAVDLLESWHTAEMEAWLNG